MPIVAEYFAEETLKDGSAVTIRAMRPDDKERLVEAFLRLQPKTVRMRFFHAKQRLGDDELGASTLSSAGSSAEPLPSALMMRDKNGAEALLSGTATNISYDRLPMT